MHKSLTTAFYQLKRFVPRSTQLALRRWLVTYQRAKYADIWPIDPSAATPPGDWRGWPDGKKFAVVLTHDVELQHGHDRCEKLMKLTQNLGFRSSFNFVPDSSKYSDVL